MVEVSQKKTDEVIEMKKTRDKARMALKRGRADWQMGISSELAYRYDAGELEAECDEAERQYGHRKMLGVAACLGCVE